MATNEQYRATMAGMNQSLQAWQEPFAKELVRLESLPRAAKSVGISRELALNCFHDPQFRGLVERLYHDEAAGALALARDARDRAELKSYKSSADKSNIHRLSKHITYLLERQYRTCDQLFPELRVLMGERWASEHSG